MKHIKTLEDFINEGAVYKGTGKLNPWFNGKIFAILKKAETGYSIQATVDDIVKLDDEFIDAKDEIFDIIEKMKRNHTGIQAVLDSIVHAIQRKYESSAPLSEGKIEDKIIDAIKQEWEEHGNKIYHSKKEYLKSLGIDPKDVDIKHIKSDKPKSLALNDVYYKDKKIGELKFKISFGNTMKLIDEGNKFRYDYHGWQQVYQAYYEKTGTHKSVTDEPLKFIDWLAKNTTPPTDFK